MFHPSRITSLDFRDPNQDVFVPQWQVFRSQNTERKMSGLFQAPMLTVVHLKVTR